MARGVNKVILIGHLGADPEVRYMPSGGAVANFSLATSEQWKDKQSGEKQERTEWHRLAVFGKLAEVAGEYLRKGSKIYAEGRLQTRKYEKDGQDHYSTEIMVREFLMLDTKSSAPAQHHQPQQQQPQQQKSPYPVNDFDDYIPF